MCDMSSYFATNPAAGYGTGPGHDQYGPSVNGDPHATLASCAENGRYAQPTYSTHPHPQLQYTHHTGHHTSPYSHHRSPYHHGTTASPYDRISDMKPIADPVLNAHQGEPSPAAGGFGWPHPPPHSVQPPSAAPSSQPTASPYESGCKANSVSTSLTPPHESHPNSQQPQQQAPSIQQFSSCKLQSAHDVSGLGHSTPPHIQMYSSTGGGGDVPSPSGSNSLIYPWMKSQFGK